MDQLVRHSEQRGLFVAPGGEWSPAEFSGPFIRLNFAADDPARFGEAGAALGNALRALA